VRDELLRKAASLAAEIERASGDVPGAEER
jgi:hypothetical protein